jgi:hypothetical protein
MIKNAPPVKHDKDNLQKDEEDKPSPTGLLKIPKRRRCGRCLKTAWLFCKTLKPTVAWVSDEAKNPSVIL